MDKLDIRSLQYDELINWCEQIGEKKFRAAQIYDWLHVKMVDSFDEMTNLSKNLRQKLNDNCECISLKMIDVQISKIDGTRKYLFEFEWNKAFASKRKSTDALGQRLCWENGCAWYSPGGCKR